MYVKGRRLFSSKQKASKPVPAAKLPVTDIMCSSEIDASFRKCPYPNVVEILRLSEDLEVTRSKIKVEFQKRRQTYRLRKHQSEDTPVRSSRQPRPSAMMTSLQKVQSLYQSVLESTIAGCSVVSEWYSEYVLMEGYTYAELLT
ncbi:hypothetical protein JTE90_007400 [Oedothorax gibbosus]|uniref:Homeobox domain-containing protein n=1 Tax=Oedothorax gibbosus TaxID=931172 RepID=A0AAV6UIF2_9ARAC|nr:hypothetical protein JTE90_007400 [Oedothorax gibbosus]